MREVDDSHPELASQSHQAEHISDVLRTFCTLPGDKTTGHTNMTCSYGVEVKQ